MALINLTVNGKKQTLDVHPETPLLWVLRDTLGLTGTKYGCGIGACGACTVHLDGEAVRSCATPIASCAGKSVTTIEGLSPDLSHPLQKAWIEEQAVQCGYCMNGHIMAAKVLLDRHPQPTEPQIRAGLSDVLCRCGTYYRIIRAVKRAGDLMKSAGAPRQKE